MGARALGAYLRFALRTTRWTLHGTDLIQPYVHGQPAVFAFWHERLPLLPAFWSHALRQRGGGGRGRMHVLVSRHRDGRLIGELVRGFGVNLVYGSTARGREQKGGAAGLLALAAMLGRGDQVAITPDGPRGPARKAAAGVAQLAGLAGVPVLPCAAQTSPRRVLPTWDRMVLPLPFGRGAIVCGEPIVVPRDGWEDSLARIEAALNEAVATADALCAA